MFNHLWRARGKARQTPVIPNWWNIHQAHEYIGATLTKEDCTDDEDFYDPHKTLKLTAVTTKRLPQVSRYKFWTWF